MAKPWWKSVRRVEARIREAVPHAQITLTDYDFGLSASVGRLVYVPFKPARPDRGRPGNDVEPQSEAEVLEAVERLKAADPEDLPTDESPWLDVIGRGRERPVSATEIGEALREAVEHASARRRL